MSKLCVRTTAEVRPHDDIVATMMCPHLHDGAKLVLLLVSANRGGLSRGKYQFTVPWRGSTCARSPRIPAAMGDESMWHGHVTTRTDRVVKHSPKIDARRKSLCGNGLRHILHPVSREMSAKQDENRCSPEILVWQWLAPHSSSCFTRNEREKAWKWGRMLFQCDGVGERPNRW